MAKLTLTIATGASRTAKLWHNREMTWDDMLGRLRTTRRTGETVAEYKAMKKSDRDQRKDVGGFVGGELKNGRRLQQNVVSRQLVCLDADSPGKDFLLDVDLALDGCAWAVYSTHSHTPEAPRLRLLVPLAHKVTPDMYPAIARRIAADVGINHFDPTTYDVHRLMYWPSSPANGEYLCKDNIGPAVDPDKILGRYDDWHDASSWPVGDAETRARGLAVKRQGDPLTKPGLIGAFNTAYFPIGTAIDAYLSDVYEDTDKPDRMTYRDGSTTGGLVIYDDRFAYSHHATDPSGGMLCNAFDLVRIHLFGDKDADTPDTVPVNKRPSYTAMMELAGEDVKVRHALSQHDLAELRSQFDDDYLQSGDDEWLDNLERGKGKNAAIKPTAGNFIIILQNDPNLKGKFGLDEFSHRLMLRGDLPWHKRKDGATWQDADDAGLRNYLSKYYNLVGKGIIDDALTEVMTENKFHPVRDYLEKLKWDGVKRAEKLYIEFLGAEDSKYIRTVTTMHLKAAVARIQRPGAKFDSCIVLSGPQGIGKSTVLAKLGGPWFNDSIVSLQGKDPMEQLQGSWIIELSEMQATNKAENDMIKGFISRQVDKFRAPYGRRTEEFPRQCVFAATTNDFIFLKDRTGGRRFWPVTCNGDGNKSLDDLTPEYVGQIWAEIYEEYRKDEKLLLPADVAKTASSLQEQYTEGSEKAGLIMDYLDKRIPDNWADMPLFDRRDYLDNYKDDGSGNVRDRVCAMEIWCEALGCNRSAMQNMNAREINAIMQGMDGWEPYSSKTGKLRFGNLYGIQRAYIRSAD